MTVARSSASAKATKLEVRNPATGEVLGTLPVHTAEDVAGAVQRARRAFDVWGSLSFRERRAHLLDFRREIVRRMGGDDRDHPLARTASRATTPPAR